MLAERDYGARLRAFRAFGMLRDKTHFIADRELVEPAIRDAVPVEIDLVAVGALDEAAILLGEKPRDPPVVGHRMQLDVPTSLANVVFEQPAGRVESVADRDMDVLMRVVRRGITADGNLAAGDHQVYANLEQIALMAARVSALDDDTARDDAIEEAFELLGPLAYSRRDRIRGIHVPEGDLKRNLHRLFPSACRTTIANRRPPRIDPAQSSMTPQQAPELVETPGMDGVEWLQPSASWLIMA
jgi:hypothetical protein